MSALSRRTVAWLPKMTHSAHVGGQRVDVIHTPGGEQALVPTAEVQELKLIGVDRRVLWSLQVDTPHPVSAPLHAGDQMVTDEAPSTGDQDRLTRDLAHVQRTPPLRPAISTVRPSAAHCSPSARLMADVVVPCKQQAYRLPG
jgi:hypothetical protein